MSARSPRLFSALGFSTTHDALDAEALLEDMGIDVVPIPAPKEIGALCGIALRVEPAQTTRALEYLDRAEIGVSTVVEIHDF